MATTVGRVRERARFAALRTSPRRGRDDGIAVRWSPTDDDVRSLALAVGRPVGGAVRRNRLRRQLRAAFVEVAPSCSAGTYLVRADPAAARRTYRELLTSLSDALLRAGAR